jgi:hypothetical protein
MKKWTIEEMMTLVEVWLVTGALNPDTLADNFQFNSPFWRDANRAEFIAQFGNPKAYQDTALSKITHFDPVVQLKAADGQHFAIVLQYHTKNGGHVYETVFGVMSDGLLAEMRSIYDLNETKMALDLH